ncbi:MAG TPA: hypothetical protein PKA05_14355, partial [Roseiflexaceae bacterium]|nr:hypothetical protein [Roseiflexaceae bacterium]
MPEINWTLLGIALSGGMILLLRDWRATVFSLLLNYLCVAVFLAQQQFITPDIEILGWAFSTTVLVKLITGLAATSILTITALTFSREYNQEDLDEFSLAELRRALLGAADEHAVARAARPFRMAIDRAFLLKGTGLVVTGTVHAGSIRVDDELFHFPSGTRARVRGLRVQDQLADTAHAGDRAALNLTG